FRGKNLHSCGNLRAFLRPEVFQKSRSRPNHEARRDFKGVVTGVSIFSAAAGDSPNKFPRVPVATEFAPTGAGREGPFVGSRQLSRPEARVQLTSPVATGNSRQPKPGPPVAAGFGFLSKIPGV